jgi:hypothetical protein
VKVVATWKKVCYKLIIIGCNRGLPIGQVGFGGMVGFLGGLLFMGGEIAQADYTGICHVRENNFGRKEAEGKLKDNMEEKLGGELK